jgi:hypothetical protein
MARSALARLMHNVPNSGSIISQAPLPALSTRHGAVGVEWLGRVAGVVSAAAARGPKNAAALSQNKCCDEAANTAREGGRVGNEGLQAIAARSRLSSAPQWNKTKMHAQMHAQTPHGPTTHSCLRRGPGPWHRGMRGRRGNLAKRRRQSALSSSAVS